MCNILSIHAFICTLHLSALHGKEEPVHKSQLVEWRRDDILVTFASQKMTLTVIGAKRSGFGGKRSLQKSKSHLFAQ
jgi:hypothetical protein